MRTLISYTSCFLLLSLLASSANAAFPTGNAINGTLPMTSWSLELEDVLTIPNSSGQAPRLEEIVSGGAPGLAYVVDQRGSIYSFNPTDASPSASTFLDLSTAVPDFNDGSQTGVRGLAFHPDFNSADTEGFRKFYTSHSRDAFAGTTSNPKFFNSPPGLNHDSVVGEWTVNANGTVDTSSYRELIRVGQPEFDHNVGAIGFNPNVSSADADYGNLYIALGDGGGGGDPNNLAQDISTTASGSGNKGFPHGSILRVNPIASGGDPFTIPADNPFVGQADAIEEIWAYGLRNPHKFTWDRVSGKMLIADIGQSNIEEINLGASGANYGWNEYEGTFQLNSTTVVDTLSPSHTTDEFTYPVAQYDRDFDNNGFGDHLFAVVGGSVYRGDAVPQLRGKYFFGDFSQTENSIFAVNVDELVQREDFTDVDNINQGFLAPFEAVRLTQNGVEKSFLQIVRDASNNQSLNRSDLRYGIGPDNEIYVINKRDGVVRRFASVTGLLEGDFNEDGTVDAADYTVWRDLLGERYSQADYDIWVANYGQTAPASFQASNVESSTSQSVPEPTGVMMIFFAVLKVCSTRRSAV